MKICRTVEDMRATRRTLGEVGFVPTMGFLHEGHLSLVRRAGAENEAIAASLFVNPLQFDSQDDLLHYPRALERDLDLLRDAGVEVVFLPDPEGLYPAGFATRVEVGGVASALEGPSRPGHFSGVATVVTKLFNILQPQRAYFGQKDAQQCAVVKRFVRDLNLPVEIVTVPTWREQDGLASSSRNARLSPAQRSLAPALFRALRAASEAFRAGERRREALEMRMRDVLLEAGVTEIDYATVVSPESFQSVSEAPEDALALLAVRFGDVRLIDNMHLAEGV